MLRKKALKINLVKQCLVLEMQTKSTYFLSLEALPLL